MMTKKKLISLGPNKTYGNYKPNPPKSTKASAPKAGASKSVTDKEK